MQDICAWASLINPRPIKWLRQFGVYGLKTIAKGLLGNPSISINHTDAPHCHFMRKYKEIHIVEQGWRIGVPLKNGIEIPWNLYSVYVQDVE